LQRNGSLRAEPGQRRDQLRAIDTVDPAT
jgi:hypothetical protein